MKDGLGIRQGDGSEGNKCILANIFRVGAIWDCHIGVASTSVGGGKHGGSVNVNVWTSTHCMYLL